LDNTGLGQLIASLLTMSKDAVAYRWFNALWHLFY
jgi:hypothetical protein